MSSATLSPVVAHEELVPRESATVSSPEETKVEGLSIIVFSEELDKALAAFTIANGAAAMDMPVNMFFTFWGLNVIRRDGPVKLAHKKTTTEGMFGRMMPKGAGHLPLSKMNMAGLGSRMIKGEMAKKHVANLGNLIRSAQEQGVHFIVCTMSMNLMGIQKEELLDGLSYGNVASFLDKADRSRISLFI